MIAHTSAPVRGKKTRQTLRLRQSVVLLSVEPPGRRWLRSHPTHRLTCARETGLTSRNWLSAHAAHVNVSSSTEEEENK